MLFFGAQGETRTRTILLSRGFKPLVYTSFTTWAFS